MLTIDAIDFIDPSKPAPQYKVDELLTAAQLWADKVCQEPVRLINIGATITFHPEKP